MDKIIPILPCQSIREQVAFYENLGFESIEIYTHPNPYAVMRYGMLVMHFYGSKKTIPSENASMCYIQVDDVNKIYETFTSNFKKYTGKIPRSGIPRLSKLRDLKNDRRFTITDYGGNTLYIGTSTNRLSTDTQFFRTIDSPNYANKFEILYDFVYSKEDLDVAYNMQIKNFPENIAYWDIKELDIAKILLVKLDIYFQRNGIIDENINDKLKELFNSFENYNSDWDRIIQKYNDIINVQ